MLNPEDSFDWSALNGKKWTTDDRTQGITSKTCVAFGVIAVLETLLKIHYYNDPDKALDLSEACLWACGHQWDERDKTELPDTSPCSNWCKGEYVQTDATWILETANNYLRNFGVADETEYPWIEVLPPTVPSGVKCECKPSSPNTQIKSDEEQTRPEEDWKEKLKRYLLTNGPCIAEYDLTEGEGSGKHCVALVGYDGTRILIKDSLHKHTYLEYDDFYNSRNGGFVQIKVHKPTLNINIAGISKPSELHLKIVKTASKFPESRNLGNLAVVDPTVQYNVLDTYNALYDKESGWFSINPVSVGGTIDLPLKLAVPPGKYKIYVKISNNGLPYFGAVEVCSAEGDVCITLQELLAPKHIIIIRAKHSQNCLEVSGASTLDAANVVQNTYQGGLNQVFKIEKVPDDPGYYRIEAGHVLKCFDIRGASKNIGINLIQFGWRYQDNQKFKIEPVSGDPEYYRIVAKHSGKCLDIKDASISDGASVIQNTPDDSRPSQRFRFDPVIL